MGGWLGLLGVHLGGLAVAFTALVGLGVLTQSLDFGIHGYRTLSPVLLAAFWTSHLVYAWYVVIGFFRKKWRARLHVSIWLLLTMILPFGVYADLSTSDFSVALLIGLVSSIAVFNVWAIVAWIKRGRESRFTVCGWFLLNAVLLSFTVALASAYDIVQQHYDHNVPGAVLGSSLAFAVAYALWTAPLLFQVWNSTRVAAAFRRQ